MSDKKKKFSWRGWITFVVTISFIADTISGIILYIAPPGRVAHWTNWTVWGLDKEEWGAIHTIFGYVLLIIVGIHLYYNWKIFWNFIWSKVRKALNLKRELITAALLCLFLFLGTLWNIPPFSSTMDLGEHFKQSWEEAKVEAPIAHAELLSLQEFAEKIKVPIAQILRALRTRGYKVKNGQQTISEVAKENMTSPNKLYEAIKSEGVKASVPDIIGGTGMGKKTIDAICSEKGLSLDDVLARLKQKGIKANPNDKLKDVANKLGKTPMEIFAIIEGKK
ncbi:MAG: DUF4405 domain-containing protein [Deltaproteobacteria bacterium]|nr:DUF4405 domain-containing protein [Deltaproteobacteria bacterium]